MSGVLLRCAVLGSLLLGACGGVTAHPDGGVVADAGAASDAGVDAGSAPDAGPVLQGPLALSASFQSADITRTGNVVVVHVQDVAGVPVEGATVALALTRALPLTGGAPAPAVVELGHGDYRADPVDFPDPGDWDLAVSAVKGTLTAGQKLTVTVP